MTHIEKETKLVLSPEDYRRLLDGGGLVECRDQLNVYLHDPARLDEGAGYLRARFESGRDPLATLKIPMGWTGEMRRMVELERPLTQMGAALYPWPRRRIGVAEQLPEEFGEHFLRLGITELRRLGWMRNLRCVIRLFPSDAGGTAPGPLGTVELDRTALPGGQVHFEVEIENADPVAHAALVERVKELAPSATFTPVGKFSRFVEAVKPLNPW